jgi:hypothetical protein
MGFLDLLDPSNDPEFFWQVISGPPCIIDNDEFHNDQQSVREAIGLKSYLLDIKFCFLLKTFQLIFEQTDVVFSILQNRTTDINFAKSRLKQCGTQIARI